MKSRYNKMKKKRLVKYKTDHYISSKMDGENRHESQINIIRS